MPFYPSKMLQAKERASTPYSFVVSSLDSHLNPSRSWERVIITQHLLVIYYILVSFDAFIPSYFLPILSCFPFVV
jgi:hypothetical protein